jgi:hypothetical protein
MFVLYAVKNSDFNLLVGKTARLIHEIFKASNKTRYESEKQLYVPLATIDWTRRHVSFYSCVCLGGTCEHLKLGKARPRLPKESQARPSGTRDSI